MYGRFAVYPLTDTFNERPSPAVPLLGVWEQTLRASSVSANPYVDLTGIASITSPQGQTSQIPLFWDGGDAWKIRFSPNMIGTWKWSVTSSDVGLDGRSGVFDTSPSDRLGGIQAKSDDPYHFEHQSGQPFWFMGDTAWAMFSDDPAENLDWPNVKRYLDLRSAQRFNVVHSMLLSEIDIGNQFGQPFEELAKEQLNPHFWSEVDRRIQYANLRGLTVGLVLAWSNKPHSLNSWATFPSRTAQLRYARYITARYSAYNVYFILAGEWNYDLRRRPDGVSEDQVRQLYEQFATTVSEKDPHHRMLCVHPSTRPGSVHELAGKSWMSLGDYQQRYTDLHQSILEARNSNKPVVNAEYAYYLRDQDGDGQNDKHNSADIDMIRHASWDIAMAGGYFITGFGSTYAGGKRHPGPYQIDDPHNVAWESQIQLVAQLFTNLNWWRLDPHDEWIASAVKRGGDELRLGVTAPPGITYWALAEPGQQYVFYMRGHAGVFRLSLGEAAAGNYQLTRFNPRSGELQPSGSQYIEAEYEYTTPDDEDWILLMTRNLTR